MAPHAGLTGYDVSWPERPLNTKRWVITYARLVALMILIGNLHQLSVLVHRVYMISYPYVRTVLVHRVYM